MKQLFFFLRSLLAGAAAAFAFTSAQPATFNISGTSWFYDAAEVPAMCMVFEPGGTLRFTGGYLGYNPSRWHQDSADPWRLDVSRSTYPRVVFVVPWVGYPFSGQAGEGGWVLLAMAAAIALLLSVALPWRQLRGRRQQARAMVHSLP